jgi:hypothetical protein
MDNTPQCPLQQFRQEVYHTFSQRADAFMDLLDALTQATQVESPVALSLSSAFRRRFSSVYDTLAHGGIEMDGLRSLLYRHHTDICQPLAGYQVYAVDNTLEPRPAAECLPERILQRQSKQQPAVACHRYSYLVGLVEAGTSWVAPLDVRRVASGHKPCEVAARQVEALDRMSDAAQSPRKVVVADSGYANASYLQAAGRLQTVSLLVRLKNNQALYGEPEPYRGHYRPRKHGAQLKLSAVLPPADEQQCLSLAEGRVAHLRAWHGYHLKNLAAVKGTVVQATVTHADGTAVFQRPLWLYWTGQQSISLEVIYRLYQWRFAIEHAFRAMKQYLGLGQANVTTLTSADNWVWLVALSYWQLLLSRDLVQAQVRPWERKEPAAKPRCYTPRQVQRAMAGLLATIGTPALPTRPAGKGLGRAMGFHPRPRTRFRLAKRGQTEAKAA